MNETLQLALTYLRMIWRYRWAAFGAALVACAVGWGAVLAMPDEYRASAKVFMDTRSMLQPVLKGLAIDTDIRQQMAIMARRTLLTRPNLEAVAREADLHLQAQTPQALEATLRRLRRGLRISGTPRDNIFNISYTHEDPVLANRVVQSLLNIFMEQSMSESRRDSIQTREFVERQIAVYERKLEAAEDRLKRFKQEHVGMMPSEGKGYYERLQAVSGQLEEARLALEEAVKRRDTLRRELGSENPTLGRDVLGGAGEPTPLEQRIAGLEGRLDELLLQYTEQHPDVIAVRSILERLRARRAGQAANGEGEGAGGPQADNPVYQELKVALGEAEAEVAALQARVAEYERRRRQLAERVDTIPEIEAQLKRLNRDYNIHKRKYEQLVARREALELTDEASESTEQIEFRIVEPPRTPVLPVGPERAKYSLAVFVLGSGGGLGFAWFLAMLRPAVFTKDELGELTGLPVLGTVSRIWTRRMLLRRRLELCSFGIAWVGLVAVLAGLVALEPTATEVADRFGVDLPAGVRALKGWLP